MKITEIQIEFVKSTNGLIGFASLVIDENIYLSSIAIHKKLNDESYRLTYPKKNNFDIYHPINKSTSQAIELAIFNRLKDVMKQVKNHDIQKI